MKRTLIQLASIAALTAGMALAQPTPAPSQPSSQAQVPAHRRWAARRQRAMRTLNLTEAQKQQAKAVFQATREKTGPMRAALRENHQAMLAAVKADNATQIRELSKKQGELLGHLTAVRSEARAKFYSILTPEQRTKLDQMHTAMHRRMEQHRGTIRSNG